MAIPTVRLASQGVVSIRIAELVLQSLSTFLRTSTPQRPRTLNLQLSRILLHRRATGQRWHLLGDVPLVGDLRARLLSPCIRRSTAMSVRFPLLYENYPKSITSRLQLEQLLIHTLCEYRMLRSTALKRTSRTFAKRTRRLYRE